MTKRVYYPKTTVQQRVRLFNIWEMSGDVSQACVEAHVSRSTFYYWKDRFEEGGYAALEEERERSPESRNTIPDEIADEIVALKRRHPTWGKWQIAREISAIHAYRGPISPNTVRRVLLEAGLWW